MSDSPRPSFAADDSEAAEIAEDLGRSYGKLLNQSLWEPDSNLGGVSPAAAVVADSAEMPLSSPVSQTPPSLLRIIEAMLFVGGLPLTAARVCEAVRGLTEEQFRQALETLNQEYRRQGRPCFIQAQGAGYVLALRPRYRAVVERLFGSVREARLSPPAIDVLALVAYRQPATKQEIDAIRGADSGALLRQLARRGLIAVVHRPEAAYRETAYGTTARFLELFGLRNLDDLPQTQDLQRL